MLSNLIPCTERLLQNVLQKQKNIFWAVQGVRGRGCGAERDAQTNRRRHKNAIVSS